MTDQPNEWYIIVNPHAGSGKTMSIWRSAEQRLAAEGISYTPSYTGYKQHATHLAYEAAAAGYRRILAVGGDGSVHEMLCGIMKWCAQNNVSASDFCIGVLPIGSGNDWLKSLDVEHNTDVVIDLMKKGACSPIDVAQVEFSDGKISYMANIGGTGFDAHVCVRVNAQKEGGKRSKMIYAKALMNVIFTLRKNRLQVIADDQTVFSGECYSIALGNGSYSGGGMRQVPAARIDDGTLNAMIVPVLPVSKIIPQVPHLFDGQLQDTAGHLINFLSFKKLHILPLDADSADVVEVDGEVEGRLPVSISLAPSRIFVLR